MKILLLYPPTARALPSILPGEVEAARGAFPPLGILYLAAAIKDIPGIKVLTINAPTQGLDAEQIAQEVSQNSIDLVGISVLSFHLLDAIEAAEKIKQKSPRSKIIAGGPHAHIYPAETLGLECFDFVALGEGEELLPDFVKQISRGEQEPAITGIYSRSQIAKADLSFCNIPDLHILEFPARRLLPIHKYFSVLTLTGQRPPPSLHAAVLTAASSATGRIWAKNSAPAPPRMWSRKWKHALLSASAR